MANVKQVDAKARDKLLLSLLRTAPQPRPDRGKGSVTSKASGKPATDRTPKPSGEPS